MKKIKLYLIGIAILFVASLVVSRQVEHNKRIKAEAESERLATNNSQLIDNNSNSVALLIRKDEMSSKLSLKVDSLSKALQIRPKQIEKIITITNTIHDTVKVPVYVETAGQDHWFLSDTMQCALYEANVLLKESDIEVQRTKFDYSNKTIQTFYKRRPHKFIFIKYGKWQYKQKINPECGDVKINTIEFIK